MQKKYIEPELELVSFRTMDVITTSDEDEGDIIFPDDPDPIVTTDPTGPVEPTTGEDEGPIL